MCDFRPPLGDVEATAPAPGSPVDGPVLLNFENTQITASAAITVDSASIVYAGYTNSTGNFVGAVRIYCILYKNLVICDKFPLKCSSTSLQPHFYLFLGIPFMQE